MSKQVFILEEDKDDWSLVRETLLELDMDIPLHFFTNSDDMFHALATGIKPDLVLVDYNSSPDNGPEVVRKLKTDPGCREIPVVVLSDSDLPLYRNLSYAAGASSFIKKPDTVTGTRKKIQTFFSYWFEVVEI